MLARLLVALGITLLMGMVVQASTRDLFPEPAEPPYITHPDPESGMYMRIPQASIYTEITQFNLNGISWEIAPWEPLAGHLAGTADLNQGNMVIAGHSEYPDGTPGIFYSLATIPTGSTITIQLAEETYHFVVTEIRSVDYRDLSVVYPALENRLTLITCDIPSYDASSNTYQSRLVVIAEPLKP